jgi:hypothetical protein
MEEHNQKLLIEEVKIIQDIIKRMAGNSFSVKTWAVTLVIATLIFRSSDNQIFIALIPLVSFWFLDAYYLRQERLFRKAHNWVVDYRQDKFDRLFEINIEPFKKDVSSSVRTMFSISILPFYGSILLILTGYLAIIKWGSVQPFLKCISTCVNPGV